MVPTTPLLPPRRDTTVRAARLDGDADGLSAFRAGLGVAVRLRLDTPGHHTGGQDRYELEACPCDREPVAVQRIQLSWPSPPAQDSGADGCDQQDRGHPCDAVPAGDTPSRRLRSRAGGRRFGCALSGQNQRSSTTFNMTERASSADPCARAAPKARGVEFHEDASCHPLGRVSDLGVLPTIWTLSAPVYILWAA